jgi:hypothetical protein
MESTVVKSHTHRIDVCSLEADMAFFEARLCLAGEQPDTVYQRAQIKTYQTLGLLLGDQLKSLRAFAAKSKTAS